MMQIRMLPIDSVKFWNVVGSITRSFRRHIFGRGPRSQTKRRIGWLRIRTDTTEPPGSLFEEQEGAVVVRDGIAPRPAEGLVSTNRQHLD